MKTIEIDVVGNVASFTDTDAGPAGTYGTVTLAFTFDSEWNGLTKKCTFQNSKLETPVDVNLNVNDECVIPSEALKYAGTMTFNAIGISGTEVKMKTVQKNLYVKNALADGQAPAPPTPDLIDQHDKSEISHNGIRVLISGKVDKEAGKSLIADTEITRLATELTGINTGDQDLSGLVPKTTTVNSKALSGNITLDKSDVGLGNVDNTADADKAVKSASEATAGSTLETTVNSKLEKDFYPFTEETTLNAADVFAINKLGTSALKRLSFTTLANWIASTFTYTLSTVSKTITGAINELYTLANNKIAKTTNVTAINETGIADGEIAVFNLTNKDIRTANVTIATTLGSDDTTVPTSKAINDKKNAANGIAGLDANAKIAVAQLPALEDWQTPTLINNWVEYDTDNVVRYRKDAFGRVYLRGRLKSGTSGTIAFTLPSGYRVTNRRVFATDGNGAYALINVNGGSVYLIGTGVPTSAWLDGASFYAEL